MYCTWQSVREDKKAINALSPLIFCLKYSAHFVSTQSVPGDRSRMSESGLSDHSCIVHGKVYARTRKQLEWMVDTVTEVGQAMGWAWLWGQTNVRLHPCRPVANNAIRLAETR